MNKKILPFNSYVPTKGPNPTVQHWFAPFVTELQRSKVFKAHATRLYRAAHSIGAISSHWLKWTRATVHRSGVLKIYEDMAQVNQLTKYA